MEIKLSKQQKITVTGSEDIYLIMRQILRRENKIGQGQEHFWMVGLNQANKILYIELVALGSSNMANINPREAFRMAIYKLAVQVIMVIIDDLDAVADENVDRLWLEEAQRRYQAYVAGETKAKPAQEVFDKARQRLRQ
ncbi:JAB domain-containing protein [Candidatus Thiosymbion oneisti]|nr:JAB domain-containing protein [Candidatus Thiosymbion oneisti]